MKTSTISRILMTPLLLSCVALAVFAISLLGWQFWPPSSETKMNAHDLQVEALQAAYDGDDVKACAIYQRMIRDDMRATDPQTEDLLKKSCLRSR